MNSIKSEIGECVLVLKRKTWGRTPLNGKLKSQKWWEHRLKELIEAPAVIIAPEDQPQHNDAVWKAYEEKYGYLEFPPPQD